MTPLSSSGQGPESVLARTRHLRVVVGHRQTRFAIAIEGSAATSAGPRRIGVLDDGSQASQNVLTAAHHSASRRKILAVAPAVTRIHAPRTGIASQRVAEFSAHRDLLVGGT